MLGIANEARIDNIKEVGLRIRALREKHSLPQDAFAERVLISRSTLSELENGKRELTGPLLVAMECMFLANREWLLTGEGGMMNCPSPGRRSYDVQSPEADEVKADAGELLEGFARLSTEGRKKILNLLRVFLKIEETGSNGRQSNSARPRAASRE